MGNAVTANIGGSWTNLIENGNKYFGTGTARNSSLTVEGLHFNSTQVPSSDVNTLDDYEEGTLSTEIGISFGGGTTGIAYGSRSGRYIKIGKLVKFTFLITLTSKGSSSGNARITGLPFTAAAAAATGTGQVNQYYNFTGLTSAPMIYVENGLTTATLFEFGSASAASITDSRFTNTSSIWGTIIYEASA
jgi:hypothetical protein